MRRVGYIVPSDLLLITPPRDGWHASAIDEVPTRSLVMAEWVNLEFENEFESLSDVLPLGERWETPSTEVSLLLSSAAQTAPIATTSTDPLSTSTPTTDPPVVEETLSSSLKKLDWPMARLIGT